MSLGLIFIGLLIILLIGHNSTTKEEGTDIDTTSNETDTTSSDIASSDTSSTDIDFNVKKSVK